MLIPHDRGSTATLNISAIQIWTLVAVMTVLSFTSMFFFSRQRAISKEVNSLRQVKRSLEFQFANSTVSAKQDNSLSAQERIELENRLRAEYEASVATITAELGELYDMEAKARSLTGLAPRQGVRERPNVTALGGKGGESGDIVAMAFDRHDSGITPPGVIYGLSEPSADLIIQEIQLRTRSLQELVVDLEARAEQIARIPSILPSTSRRWEVSSPFGYRKDPFTFRMRQHTGVDISGTYGSDVVATARGKVTFAGRDGALGITVRVDHGGGIETVYAHLKEASVKPGVEVDRKDVIGKLGSTGRTTGPHIHYEVRVSGKPVDPQKYFRD